LEIFQTVQKRLAAAGSAASGKAEIEKMLMSD
jgi:hypothetical protein